MSKDSKIQGILEKWRHSGSEVQKTEVGKVLDYFFPDKWHDNNQSAQSGSHEFKVTDNRLKGYPAVGPDGDFVIPVTGGKHVKNYYLKKLLKLIEQIDERGER